MKKLILCLLLLGFTGIGHSQIELRETKVDYSPVSMKVDPATNTVTLNLPEKNYGEFQNDPLVFLKRNFNIHQFLQENEDLGFSTIQVIMKSRKGHLRANFSDEGSLISTYHRFNNVALPEEARQAIFRNYPGYSVAKNSHIAKSKKGVITKEFYRVKLQNGEKAKRIRLNKSIDGVRLAGN